MVAASQLSDQNENGLLTVPLSDYENCLKCDRKTIYKLLDQETTHWDQNLEDTKARAESMKDGLQQFIAEQTSALEEYLLNF